MEINGFTIDVQRQGGKARLKVQSKVYGVIVMLTLEELEGLTRELAQAAQAWRQDLARVTADYYAVLGMARDASDIEIQQAYRARAKQYHPDLHDTGEHAEMTKVNVAHEVLSDPSKRKQYDSMKGVA